MYSQTVAPQCVLSTYLVAGRHGSTRVVSIEQRVVLVVMTVTDGLLCGQILLWVRVLLVIARIAPCSVYDQLMCRVLVLVCMLVRTSHGIPMCMSRA